ncbi:MAG: ATP-binding protein [Thermoplasmata archaeon]|nr:ATP-binding protein [Thermoplasmata archaeon]
MSRTTPGTGTTRTTLKKTLSPEPEAPPSPRGPESPASRRDSHANSGQPFDLNIEEILDNWEVHHALRELIANALDEQCLSGTAEVRIDAPDTGRWLIRDFGRGLRYEHLTQKESTEKLADPRCVGQFGIGLKDALATLYRKGVTVRAKSRFAEISTGLASKAGFADIRTLHAFVLPPSDGSFQGTEVTLDGVPAGEMELAKSLFLRFSGERVIESGPIGDVIERRSGAAPIYVKGVRVAVEDNSLFGYNITSLTKQLTKSLNRERSNVGRAAYTDRVKGILRASTTLEIAQRLMTDLQEFSSGRMHDELSWLDIQEHAVQILNSRSRSVFLTAREMLDNPMMIDEAKRGGFAIVQVPENLKTRISGSLDVAGNAIRDFAQFQQEYSESFVYKFVELTDLSLDEKKVFSATPRILELSGGKPPNVRRIRVSETISAVSASFGDADGVWDGSTIIIKRSVLRRINSYATTLLHEAAHARSGAPDCTRAFEAGLSAVAGTVTANALARSVVFAAETGRKNTSRPVQRAPARRGTPRRRR